MTVPWEVGSEFHWSGEFLGRLAPEDLAPAGANLFARASGALAALMVQATMNGHRPRLHLPSYFCMDVAERLTSVCDVHWFHDLPTRSSPDFDTLDPAPGDFVLALNHFGQWESSRWYEFAKPPGVLLIEDHSHDPFSDWMRSSNADFALASLRKTLPVSDGAWLWSPTGLKVPEPAGPEPAGAGMKLAAMMLKAAYLEGGSIDKGDFRALQVEGERLLDEPPFAPASRFTAAILPFVDGRVLRARRIANNARMTARLSSDRRAGLSQLQPNIAIDVPAFSPVLVCDDRATRDQLRTHLQHHAIFAPNHWPQDADKYNSGDPDAIRLAGRLLTLPVDFRYRAADVDRVADIVSSFRPTSTAGSDTSA